MKKLIAILFLVISSITFGQYSPYYTKTQVDSKIDPLKVDIEGLETNTNELNQEVNNLGLIVEGLSDGSGGKYYPNITTAMAVTPLPDDGVPFIIDEENEAETGVYVYDSTVVPDGYRFVRSFVKVENSLTSTSDTNALSAKQGKELNDKIINLTYEKSYEEIPTNFNSSGAYRADNGNSAASSDYVRIPTNGYISIEIGKKYAYSGLIDSATYAGVIFKDDDNTFIGSEAIGVNTFEKHELTIPAGATRMVLCSKNTATEIGLFEVIETEKVFFEEKNIVQEIIEDVSKVPSSEAVKIALDKKADNTEDNYNKIVTNFNASGAYRADNGNTAGASGYVRTATTAYVPVEEGVRYAYSGEINNSTYAGVIFRNEDSTFLGSVCSDVAVYDRFEFQVPVGATRMLITSLNVENKGLYKIEEQAKVFGLKKYKTFTDFNEATKQSKSISGVGSFLLDNDTQRALPINKQVIEKPHKLQELNADGYQLQDWDNIRNIGYFSKNYSIYESEDLVNFTLLNTFTESVYGVRACTDGEIVIATRGVDGINPAGIWRSYDGKTEFTKVYEFESASTNVSPSQQWGFEAHGEIFILNNYDSRPHGEREDARVYFSVDNGNTWEVVFDMYESSFYDFIVDQDPTEANKAHIHGCCYDPYEDRIWIATGDSLHKWIIYSNANVTQDLESIEWFGIYINDDPRYGSMQMCPAFATRFGILLGSDFRQNGIYIAHRDLNPGIDLIHRITPDDTSRITFIPRKFVQGDSGIIYAPCGYMYNESQPSTDQKNHVVVTADGINWVRVYESENNLTSATIEIVVRERDSDFLIYDSAENKFIIMTIPKAK
jgi:hypothetical protein